MKKEISKNLQVVCIRNGVEISIEQDRAKLLIEEMEKRRFIKINEKIINTADIVGIFSASDIEDVIKRKNGEFKYKGKWYPRGTKVCHKCGEVLPYGYTCGICTTGYNCLNN